MKTQWEYEPKYRQLEPVPDKYKRAYLRAKLARLDPDTRYCIDCAADALIDYVKAHNGSMQMSRDGAYSVLAALGSFLNESGWQPV